MMHQTSFINLYMCLINLSLHLYYSIFILTMTDLKNNSYFQEKYIGALSILQPPLHVPVPIRSLLRNLK